MQQADSSSCVFISWILNEEAKNDTKMEEEWLTADADLHELFSSLISLTDVANG